MSCFNCVFYSTRRPKFPELNQLSCDKYGADVIHHNCGLNCSAYEEDRYVFTRARRRISDVAAQAHAIAKKNARASRAPI